MTEATLTPEVEKSFESEIVTQYEKNFGNAGLVEFKKITLPLCQKVLGGSPQAAETIDTLISVAMKYKSTNKLADFWTSEVTQDTFEFQRDFDKLRQSSHIQLEPFAFHINDRRLLEEEISEGMLTPGYLLLGEDYDEDDDRDEENDDYTVYFASGTVEELAKFLVGHALVSRPPTWGKSDYGQISSTQSVDELFKILAGYATATKTSNWDNTEYSQMNSPQFVRTEAIAMVDTSKVSMKYAERDHSIRTLYSPENNREAVDTYVSHQSVPVSILRLPLTVLLPEQIDQLRDEGAKLYISGHFYTGNLPFKLENAQQAADIYAYSKHQELAIKHKLLQLAATAGIEMVA